MTAPTKMKEHLKHKITCNCGNQMRLQKQRVVSKGNVYFYDRYVCDKCRWKRQKENQEYKMKKVIV